MSDPYALSWLEPAPADFRARIKAIAASDPFDIAGLRRLALTDLDVNQLERTSRAIRSRPDALAACGLEPVTLGIVASHTVSAIAGALPATAVRHGIALKVAAAEYGQAAQQLLDPGSALAQAAPDAVLIALDAAAIGLNRARLDPAEGEGAGEGAVAAALDHLGSLIDACGRTIGAPVIVQTLVPPADSLFGSLDGSTPGTVRWMIHELNGRLARMLAGRADVLFDVAHLAGSVGLNAWLAPRLWHDAKMPFAIEAVGLYGDHLCRILGAMRGRARKCLVLDLDNTLWGGVIGDDGVEGLRLGQGSGTGEAFLAIQDMALQLRQRGVILAVCSKNDDANARLPFRSHDEMLLKEEHIAAFVANWTDKASNLKAIAEALNIGTDALVFMDDNPAEREQVRQALPEVAVPEIGSDPAQYVNRLMQAGYFEALSFATEDRSRAEMYRADADRLAARKDVRSLEDYLASLDMVCTIVPFGDAGRARIAQLTNKSNQFNLTTRRRTEAEVAAVMSDPAKFAVQVRLADRFGDNGMISVAVFDRGGDAWTCDTWLMSCRVLGRRVEEAVLAHVAASARAAGASRLVGEYLPTAKNGLVRDHFAKLGFSALGEGPDGRTRWVLELDGYAPPDLPMRIVADFTDAGPAPSS